MVQKKEYPIERSERLRVKIKKLMKIGFSLSKIIKELGLSAYRVRVIVSGKDPYLVAMNHFTPDEMEAFDGYFAKAKDDIEQGLSRDWFDGLEMAEKNGLKISPACRGFKISLPQLRYRYKRGVEKEGIMSYFSNEDQKRIRSYLQKILAEL